MDNRLKNSSTLLIDFLIDQWEKSSDSIASIAKKSELAPSSIHRIVTKTTANPTIDNTERLGRALGWQLTWTKIKKGHSRNPAPLVVDPDRETHPPAKDTDPGSR